MAKARRTNTAASALGSLLNTIGTVAKVELEGKPEALAEVEAMVAGVKDSNFVTAAEHLDDNIETAHQVDEVFDAAGVDRVEHQRQGAVEGAAITVAAIEAGGQDELEGAQDEPTD